MNQGVAQISAGVDQAENDSATIQAHRTQLIRLGGQPSPFVVRNQA